MTPRNDRPLCQGDTGGRDLVRVDPFYILQGYSPLCPCCQCAVRHLGSKVLVSSTFLIKQYIPSLHLLMKTPNLLPGVGPIRISWQPLMYVEGDWFCDLYDIIYNLYASLFCDKIVFYLIGLYQDLQNIIPFSGFLFLWFGGVWMPLKYLH